MRVLLPLPLLLLAAAPAATAVPDTGTTALAPDSDQRWIPFTLTPGNQVQFTVMLDGSPVAALLDTGASHTLMTRDYAARTGRRVDPRGAIAAIGGKIAAGWTPVRAIAFGGLARSGGGVDVVALPAMATGNGDPIVLLVGRDLLDRYALDIDHAAGRFRLLPSGRLPFAGTRAPLRIGRAPLAYVTEVTLAGRRLRPIIVDTGDGAALTLSREAWRNLPFANPPATTTQVAYGAGGQLVAEVAVLPDLRVGGRVAGDVPVWIERSGGFSDAAGAMGRIGTGLLQRYRVLLDPEAGHMILAPGGATAPLSRSTSGFQLGLDGTALQVLHVMRGGPAQAAGWRVGERICAVDGMSVAADPARAARSQWLFGAPGTVVRLDLCDGSRRTLTLRRFY